MRFWVIGPLVLGCAAWQPTAPPKPLKVGPLAYYSDHCARCHSAFGAAYPDDFTKDKTAAELTEIIRSMAAGQGGSPLTEKPELEAQVAFHYAMDTKKPFLSWTGSDGQQVRGEVTLGVKLTASASGSDLAVSVAKGIWHVTLPGGANVNGLVVTATKGEAKSVLDLSKQAFSVFVDKKG